MTTKKTSLLEVARQLPPAAGATAGPLSWHAKLKESDPAIHDEILELVDAWIQQDEKVVSALPTKTDLFHYVKKELGSKLPVTRNTFGGFIKDRIAELNSQ